MQTINLFYIPTKKWMTVYDIAYDQHGYPHFLIYEDGQWKRVSAKHFRPCPESEAEWIEAEW